MGPRGARAPAHEHVRRRPDRRRDQRAADAHVELRRRDLALPAGLVDGLLLPERRGRRGDLRPRGLRERSRRPSGTCPTRKGTTSSSRAARPTGSCPKGEQRYLVFETPGLIEIPRRYRNQYGQILEGAPYYHRDIHPPAELKTHRERGDSPRQGARPRRVPGLRPRLPPVRRRRLGRLPLPVDVLDPRLRADHRQDPPAAALAPDVPGAELRHLLVLPAPSRLRSRRRCRSRTTTAISSRRR